MSWVWGSADTTTDTQRHIYEAFDRLSGKRSRTRGTGRPANIGGRGGIQAGRVEEGGRAANSGGKQGTEGGKGKEGSKHW